MKRTPANVSNLLDILKILGYASHGAVTRIPVTAETINIWGAGRIKDIGLSSDVSIAGYSTVSAAARVNHSMKKTTVLHVP